MRVALHFAFSPSLPFHQTEASGAKDEKGGRPHSLRSTTRSHSLVRQRLVISSPRVRLASSSEWIPRPTDLDEHTDNAQKADHLLWPVKFASQELRRTVVGKLGQQRNGSIRKESKRRRILSGQKKLCAIGRDFTTGADVGIVGNIDVTFCALYFDLVETSRLEKSASNFVKC